MTIAFWLFIGFVVLLVVIGLRDWFRMIVWSWFDNGILFTVLMIIFFVLFFSPSIVKYYAPNYYGLSIWLLILYSLGLIAFRFMRKSNKNNDYEG